MTQLGFHPRTKVSLDAYLLQPNQALALIGPSGSGKTATALFIAEQLLEAEPQTLINKGRLIHVTKQDKTEISIDTIRQLIKSLATKPSGTRIIYIEDAQLMSLEAQNALLKTLEEPNELNIFILGLTNAGAVLPTVLSRLNKLHISPLTKEQALEQFSSIYHQKDIESAWQLSEGQMGLMVGLLSDTDEQQLKLAVNDARAFLKQSRYERMVGVDALSRDKDKLSLLLKGLGRVLKVLHYANIKRDSSANASKLLLSRKQVAEAQTALLANASPRLVLLKLIMTLNI